MPVADNPFVTDEDFEDVFGMTPDTAGELPAPEDQAVEEPTLDLDITPDDFADVFGGDLDTRTDLEKEVEEFQSEGWMTRQLKKGAYHLAQTLAGFQQKARLPDIVPINIKEAREGGLPGADIFPTREETTQRIMEIQKKIDELPKDPRMEAMVRAAREQPDMFSATRAFGESFWDAPDKMGFVLAQAAEQAPNIATFVLLTRGTGGFAAGTGKLAQMGAFGAASAGTSAASTFGPNIAEALVQGLEYDDAEARAAKKTFVQAMVDGSVGAVLPLKIGPSEWINVPVQTGLQMLGGGFGDAAAKISVGEKVDRGEFLAESFMELLGLPADLGSAAYAKYMTGSADTVADTTTDPETGEPVHTVREEYADPRANKQKILEAERDKISEPRSIDEAIPEGTDPLDMDQAQLLEDQVKILNENETNAQRRSEIDAELEALALEAEQIEAAPAPVEPTADLTAELEAEAATPAPPIREEVMQDLEQGSYPKTLNVSEVTEHINRRGRQPTEVDVVQESAGGAVEFEKRQVAVKDIVPDRDQPADVEAAKRYAKAPASAAPPVVLGEGGKIIDGRHRLAAAKIRGDETITAYVPVRKPTPAEMMADEEAAQAARIAELDAQLTGPGIDIVPRPEARKAPAEAVAALSDAELVQRTRQQQQRVEELRAELLPGESSPESEAAARVLLALQDELRTRRGATPSTEAELEAVIGERELTTQERERLLAGEVAPAREFEAEGGRTLEEQIAELEARLAPGVERRQQAQTVELERRRGERRQAGTTRAMIEGMQELGVSEADIQAVITSAGELQRAGDVANMRRMARTFRESVEAAGVDAADIDAQVAELMASEGVAPDTITEVLRGPEAADSERQLVARVRAEGATDADIAAVAEAANAVHKAADQENLNRYVDQLRNTIADTNPDMAPSDVDILIKDMLVQDGTPQSTINGVMGVANLDLLADGRSAFQHGLDTFIRLVQDKFIEVQRMQERIEAQTGERIPGMTLHMDERNMHGRIPARLRELEYEHMRPLLDEMSRNNIDMDTLNEYLYAKHAKDRNAAILERNPEAEERGLNSGMSDEEADWVLEQNADKSEVLDALAQRVYDTLSMERDILVESGLVSEADVQQWVDSMGENYVPLRSSDVDGAIPRRTRGLQIKGREKQTAVGRRSQAQDILANVFSQLAGSILRAEQAKVGQHLLSLVEAFPDENFWKVDATKEVATFDKKTGELEYKIVPDNTNEHTFVTKRDGKEYRIWVADPKIVSAMRNLGAEPMGKTLRAAATVNRYLAMINTTFNFPEFAMTNLIRDVQTAVLNVQGFDKEIATNLEGNRAAISAKIAKGIPSALSAGVRGFAYPGSKFASAVSMFGNAETQAQWDATFKEFSEAGGSIEFFDLRDVETLNKDMLEILNAQEPTAAAATKRAWHKTKHAGLAINSAIENSVRLSVFKSLRDIGVEADIAANVSRQVTVDFAKKGEIGPALNALYLFYNASIQGSARLVYNMATSKTFRRLAGGLVLSGFLFDSLAREAAGEDDEGRNYMDQIPAHIRRRNFVWMTNPEAGEYIKFPQPYGFNVLWLTGTQLSALAHGGTSPTTAGGEVLAAMSESFNPVGGDDDPLKMVMPSQIRPLYELRVNSDFAGRKIHPDQPKFGPRKPDSQLYWPNVSPVSREFTDAMNTLSGGTPAIPGAVDVSPESIDHMAATVTGGIGQTIARLVAMGGKMAGGEDVEAFEVPLLRKFVGTVPKSQITQNYITATTNLDYLLAEQDRLAKDGTSEERAAFKRRYGGPLQQLETRHRVVSRRLKLLYRQKRMAEDSAMDDERKEAEVERLRDEIYKLRDEFNLYYIEQMERTE